MRIGAGEASKTESNDQGKGERKMEEINELAETLPDQVSQVASVESNEEKEKEEEEEDEAGEEEDEEEEDEEEDEEEQEDVEEDEEEDEDVEEDEQEEDEEVQEEDEEEEEQEQEEEEEQEDEEEQEQSSIPAANSTEARAAALRRAMKFNMALFGLTFLDFAFNILPSRSTKGHGECNAKKVQFTIVLTLDILSFALLCFASGMAGVVLQRLHYVTSPQDEEAQTERSSRILAGIVVAGSIAGIVCLMIAIVLSLELKIGKFRCQPDSVKGFIASGGLIAGAGGACYSYVIIQAFLT